MDSQILSIIVIPAFLMSMTVELIRAFHVPAGGRSAAPIVPLHEGKYRSGEAAG